MNEPSTVYFLCETFTGYRNFFLQKVPQPEGLPPLYNTWNGYVERGHRVHVFSQDYQYDGYQSWVHEEKQMHNIPVPFTYLRRNRYTLGGKMLFRLARLIGLHRLRKTLLRVARSDPPAIVYSCSPYCSIVARHFARRLNAVHIVRRFGTVLFEQTRGKGKGLQDSLYVEAREYRQSYDMLVMGNDGTRGDEVALHYGCPREKLRFWTNGIDKTLSDPKFDRAAFRRRLGFPEDTPLILSLSRLAGWKRIDRVLEVMKKVKSVRADARLLIIGSGEIEGQLKKLAKDLAVNDVTRFVGPVQHKDVRDYLNGCDIYVQFFDLTNRCNPLFEAMICGMPVVTLDDPSIDDLVTDQRTALRVENDDMGRAAQHVLDLIGDDRRRRSLGAAAREHILSAFQTWPQRIEMEIKEVLQLVENVNHNPMGRTAKK